MAKFTFLCTFALVGAVLANDESQYFKNIADSVARADPRAREEDVTAYADKKACYPDIGCFTVDGPMKQTGILPFPPEKIATAFYAYTPSAPLTEHLVDPHKPATFSPIDAKKRLAIIIHGFGNSHTTERLVSIKNNLLKHTNGEVGSVIVVDWKRGAAEPDYNEASTNTQVVGRQVAFLVNQLKQHHGVSPHSVYLIGFSLGAQVAGFAGKYSQSTYSWKFGRITGLDAAAPMFENHAGAYLTKTDAVFVDGIHTSAGNNLLLGEVGFIKPYGHLDFFPNSGHHQPQCHNLFKISCNHYSSVEYYDASLSAAGSCKFTAYPCADWATFKEHHCTKADAELGYWADKSGASGVRYLTTTGKYPFCK